MGETILCVDDEVNVLRVLKRIFTYEGYEVLTAVSGEEGLQYLGRAPIPVIISDYRMPGMSGVEFLEKVIERSPDSIRIMLTGYADTDAAIASINKGHVYRFLTKPWEENDLRVTVKEAMRLYGLLIDNRELNRQILEQNEQLRMFNATLEQKVEERTRDLQEAYQKNVALMEELKRTIKELEGRDRILEYLSSGLHEIDDTLTMIVQVIADVLDVERVVIYLADKEEERLEARAGVGEPDPHGVITKEDLSLLPVYTFDDVSPIARAFREQRPCCPEGSRATLSVPILYGGVCMGGITVDNKRGGRLIPDNDTRILGRLAINVAVAVHDAQLAENLMTLGEGDLDRILEEI